MTRYATVHYSQDGPVAILTLNRPDAMNSFDAELRADLLKALTEAGGDPTVRVVVLSGEGRSFSAGADLKSGLADDANLDEMLQSEYRPIFERIEHMSKPVIAAVGGSAAGIGMSLALMCDLLVMADDAFMLAPFTTISLVPDGGLNWLLVQQLGYRRAFQLAVEAERIPAARCLELGLANRLASANDLLEEAVGWANSLAQRAPLSLAATKQAMRHAASGTWASTFDLEASLQRGLHASDDCREGVSAFFEKRKPEFKGR